MSGLRAAELLTRNRAWSEQTRSQDPEFFRRLSSQQSPQFLWIGCSDSRVPANQITGLVPGQVFVHRNVSNLAHPTDVNLMSVLEYAVDVLKVSEILVVGHYGCGGVLAALQNRRIGLADNWIRHVQDVRHKHRTWLDGIADEALAHKALCELNVLEQSLNVCESTVVQDAWAREQSVVVHGWVYGLHNGLLEDLSITVTCAEDVDPAYSRALGAVTQRALLAMARLNQAKAAALAGGEGI